VRLTPVIVPLLITVAALAACSSPDSGVETADGPSASSVSPPTSPLPVPPPDTTSDGGGRPALTGRQILASVGPSLAFVETPFATGSGLVVADRFVLTNLHVVEPFGSATITVGGSEQFEAVPVAGVDVALDLALLGPIEVEAPSLAPEAPTGLAAGDELYLVGYPGESAVTPEPTISRGILSRIRTLPGWEQTYLQTDAAIAGGQSGGALVDGEGRLVGLSGLSFGDGNFALALSGADLAGAVDGLTAGGGDRYRALPASPTDVAGTLALAGPQAEQMAVLHNEGRRRSGSSASTRPARPCSPSSTTSARRCS
jgi:serine protease DegQ